jgi:3-oxoacyl-[acyl-carrier-protein] synthase II
MSRGSIPENRVVVTGLGAVTPLGIGVADFWQALLDGCNGIAQVSHFDISGYRSTLAAEVKDFRAEDYFDRKLAKQLERFAQFALLAAREAFADSGLLPTDFEATRAGVVIGSGIGGIETLGTGYRTLAEKSPRSIHPLTVSRYLLNMAACQVTIELGFQGPISAPSVACSTGAVAIGDALRILQRGDADIMLAGGSEACIEKLAYGGFCATRSMTTNSDPETASRPFDANRDGFVMGEGAGVVLLETLDHALARGATILAELKGYGNTADAYHLTAPGPGGEGMARVMRVALDDADLVPGNVDYINAHGTSTVLNDSCESAAIATVFGDRAKKVKVSSNKSMIGHLMAAAGAVEFVSTVRSVQTGLVPPTIHYRDPDPDCLLDYTTSGAIEIEINTAITNSFGFGGGNACLALGKYKGDKHGNPQASNR